MESSEPHDEPDPPDWELLSALFARGGEFRHKMGLRRADAAHFYAATVAGPAILREKRAILAGDRARRAVVTPEGHQAAVGFARFLGLNAGEEEREDEHGWLDYNERLSLLLEPDLLLVAPPDWTLIWANVCFPSRWSLEGKAGQTLSWIHAAVPELNAELGSKISAFFSRLIPGEGWRRANWGLSASCRRDQHPAEAVPSLTASTPSDRIFIRVEDQHLIKLPASGAIAFGIRVASFAWPEVKQHSAISDSLLEQLRSMPPEIAGYKSLNSIIPVMLAAS